MVPPPETSYAARVTAGHVDGGAGDVDGRVAVGEHAVGALRGRGHRAAVDGQVGVVQGQDRRVESVEAAGVVAGGRAGGLLHRHVGERGRDVTLGADGILVRVGGGVGAAVQRFAGFEGVGTRAGLDGCEPPPGAAPGAPPGGAPGPPEQRPWWWTNPGNRRSRPLPARGLGWPGLRPQSRLIWTWQHLLVISTDSRLSEALLGDRRPTSDIVP